MLEGKVWQALVEQLWERSEEGRKETDSEAKYRNRERMHGKPGRKRTGKTEEAKAEDEHIVNDAAFAVREAGVLDLAVNQCCHVV